MGVDLERMLARLERKSDAASHASEKSGAVRIIRRTAPFPGSPNLTEVRELLETPISPNSR